jgi:hypothetical protein
VRILCLVAEGRPIADVVTTESWHFYYIDPAVDVLDPVADSGALSDLEELQCGIKGTKVIWIRCHDTLTLAPRTDHDVRITDVGGTARGEQPSDVGCVNPVERDDVGPRLSDHSRQADLTFWSADGLGKSRRWNGDRCAHFICACE